MQIINHPLELTTLCHTHRQNNRRIGFVPTMGYLHQGHQSLMRYARQQADIVVVSIFVNPKQFGPGEDLARYPRDLPGDMGKCREENVDVLFVPSGEMVYPSGFQSYVDVERLTQGLCGANRPGHFRGVCTVVTKLFNMVGPCTAFFGEKDYQQLQVIRCMVKDLNQPVEVYGCPIVRETDGLAMSSRNKYLNPKERQAALCLHNALAAVEKNLIARGGSLSAAEARQIAAQVIEAEPLARLEYLEIRHAESLEPHSVLGNSQAVMAMAVFIGKTRLIDNQVF